MAFDTAQGDDSFTDCRHKKKCGAGLGEGRGRGRRIILTPTMPCGREISRRNLFLSFYFLALPCGRSDRTGRAYKYACVRERSDSESRIAETELPVLVLPHCYALFVLLEFIICVLR